jgi:hypothetical protein
MTDLEKQKVYLKVNKELKKIKPAKLNSLLWEKGHAHTMGYGSGDSNKEIYDIVMEDMELFEGLYYEWHSICSSDNANGKNEDFNEHIEEYYPNIDEDVKWDIANDWVDEDGFTYGAYVCYITELVETALEEIAEEKFETDYKEYRLKLESIEGLVVDDSYFYPNARYWDRETKVINGFEVYTYDDDETTNDIGPIYIEYSAEEGWSYGDYDEFDSNVSYNTFDELFDYLKKNVYKLEYI